MRCASVAYNVYSVSGGGRNGELCAERLADLMSSVFICTEIASSLTASASKALILFISNRPTASQNSMILLSCLFRFALTKYELGDKLLLEGRGSPACPMDEMCDFRRHVKLQYARKIMTIMHYFINTHRVSKHPEYFSPQFEHALLDFNNFRVSSFAR